MNKGFSLIELVIAVAIIAIIASVAIPQYQTYLLRTHVTIEATTARSQIENAIAEYIANTGKLPQAGYSDLTQVGFLQDNGNPHTNVSLATPSFKEIDWDGTNVTMTFIDNHEQAPLSGKTIQITVLMNDSDTQFNVSGGTLPNYLLP